MINILDKIDNLLGRILLALSGVAVLTLMLLATANVVLRIFHAPYRGTYEIVSFLGAIGVAFALASTQRKKGHIVVDILSSRYPRPVRRFVDVLSAAISALFFGIVARQVFLWGARIMAAGEVSETLKIIYHPFVFGVTAGFALLALTCLLDIPRALSEGKGEDAMSGPLLGVAGIAVMFAILFLLRIPAGFTMAIVGFFGLAYATSFTAATGMIGGEMWNIFSGYGLTVIPMFILVGEFVHYAGYNDSLYHATNRWFGHYRGGLAITTIMACAAFSAISGSNTATAATMSTVAIPAMKKYHYHPALNAGSVAAGATLGVLIPPSIVLVVYGIYTGQSIGKLFFGNIIPSAIATVLIAATVWAICRRHPDWGPAAEKSTWKQRFQALPEALDIIILFAVIMYALFTGVVTATEAAAVSCTLGLAICMARRKLSFKGFVAAVSDTVRISCMVFMIIAGAVIFGRFLAITRLPFEAAGWIGSLDVPRELLLTLILLCYIVGGCIMDALAFLLVSLPIFYPLVVGMGYDPIWFGQVITIVTTMGAIMPPIGICCYVVAAMAKDIPLSTVFRGALYYIPAYIVTLIILALFPYGTVLILSNLVR